MMVIPFKASGICSSSIKGSVKPDCDLLHKTNKKFISGISAELSKSRFKVELKLATINCQSKNLTARGQSLGCAAMRHTAVVRVNPANPFNSGPVSSRQDDLI
jgi:hypothetical protein